MITLIHGVESYLVNKQKENRIHTSGIAKENITVFDGSDTSFQLPSLIQECNTISLFDDHRLILVTNPPFLKESKSAGRKGKKTAKKKDESPLVNLFEEYCKNPGSTTELILVCEGYDAKNNDFFKILQSYQNKTVTIVHCDALKPWELEKRIDQILYEKHYRLTRDARKELLLRVGNSISAFYTALDKMEGYGKKDLDEKDIGNLCSFNPDINAFKLGNAFIRNDTEGVLETYRDCLMHGNMSVQSLLPMFASQIRKGFMIMRCYECHLSNPEIAEKTGSARVDKDLDTYIRHDSHWYLSKLNACAKIDAGMKNGTYLTKESLETAFEWLLLGNNRG